LICRKRYSGKPGYFLANSSVLSHRLTMSITELHKLSPLEKMKIIEVLWDDLSTKEESFDSPVWHEAKLRKAEADFTGNRNDVMDWGDAKRLLRKQFE
jgi:hypothetical protein